MKLRRGRRRNRIPYGLLASVALSMLVVLTVTLSAGLMSLPTSAKNHRMPRIEGSNGVVTDGDGIIDSNGIAGDIPEVTDLIPQMPNGRTGNEGSDALDPAAGDVTGETNAPETSTPVTSERTTDATTTDMIEEMTGSDTATWIIGAAILAVVVIAIVLIIRFASAPRRRG